MRERFAVMLATCLMAGSLCASAAASEGCAEPGTTWQRASPASQGLDPDQLNRAIHAYQDRRAYTLRIFRNGCLVASDTGVGNEQARYDGWEITSSVLGLLAGREMQMGLLSDADLVGALVPDADAAHGAITVRSLMERTSGLAGEADNTFVPDRLRRALARPVVHPPGESYGDAPVARALLVAVLQAAAGEDLQQFAAGELFAPLGISSFGWSRDHAGNTNGSFGLSLTAEDLARLAELVRRGGAWRGRQLLDPAYVAKSLQPSARNPCFGWLTWLNSETGCNGTNRRLIPGMPADLWAWRGRYDQRVVVIRSLGLVVVRYGTTGGDFRSGHDEATWESDSLSQLLRAVRDVKPSATPADGLPPDTGEAYADNAFAGFGFPPPGAPGPRRARAPQLSVARTKAGRARLVGVRIACPPVPQRDCSGTAVLTRLGKHGVAWSTAAGSATTVLLRLRHRPRAPHDAVVRVTAADDGGGVVTDLALRVLP